eukprot:366496-Chlamydomonas_euryale.AAC.15
MVVMVGGWGDGLVKRRGSRAPNNLAGTCTLCNDTPLAPGRCNLRRTTPDPRSQSPAFRASAESSSPTPQARPPAVARHTRRGRSGRPKRSQQQQQQQQQQQHASGDQHARMRGDWRG